MALGSTDEERLADLLSRLGWSEWLIGPYVVGLSLNSDGELDGLSCQSLTADLTLRDVNLILPEERAWLLSIASPDLSIGDTHE